MFSRIARIANKDSFSRFQSRNPSLFCNKDAFSMFQLRNPRLLSNIANKGALSTANPRLFYNQAMDSDSSLVSAAADNFSFGFKLILSFGILVYTGVKMITYHVDEKKENRIKQEMKILENEEKKLERDIRHTDRKIRNDEIGIIKKLIERSNLQMQLEYRATIINVMEHIEEKEKKIMNQMKKK